MPLVEHRPGNSRLLKASDGTVKLNLYIDGVLADADTAVAVDVLNAAGTSIASTSTASTTSTGVYELDVADTAVPNVDSLDATWTVTHAAKTYTFLTRHEVTGDRLLNTRRLRDFGRADLASTTTFTDVELVDAVAAIEEFFEDYCRVSFVPRHTKSTLDGDGTQLLQLPRLKVTNIFAATIDGTAITTASLVTWDTGQVWYEDGWDRDADGAGQNVVVRYAHGFAHPPAQVQRAALLLLEDILPAGHRDRKAMVVTDETGTYRLAVPGAPRRPTGLPEVDYILNKYREPLLV